MNINYNCSNLGDGRGTYEVKNYHGIEPRSFLAGSRHFYVSELEIFQIEFSEFKKEINKISMETISKIF